MKHSSKKLLESAIATLHLLLDGPNGQEIFTTPVETSGRDALDIVNDVLKPNTEGFYIVAASVNGKIDGFFISRKPADGAPAETPADSEADEA